MDYLLRRRDVPDPLLGRAAVRFSKSRFDSPVNVLFVMVGFVRPHDVPMRTRFDLNAIIAAVARASCVVNYDRSIRRSFECHSAPAVLRICAGVNDQFIAGLQSVSQRFELFLISIWRRWLALVHAGRCGLNSEKEQETKARDSDGAGNVH